MGARDVQGYPWDHGGVSHLLGGGPGGSGDSHFVAQIWESATLE